ncbi:MAG TPA: glutamate-1-semialdehyde 2,1-aminomutase [Vicinamibacteria bacterium]|jgi:glutamate-1-semialdehyde 2,1-aminomutase|nr:glutamate-1-semialdehyde 2,1-aminomutase [Vicinamibacteria bacterium]
MTQSEELFARAQRLIPGGVNSPVRAFKAVGGTPLFIRKAEGARMWDADGKGYIDYVGSWGPLILGHAHPSVIEAITQAAVRGTSYGAPCAAEVELADRVVRLVPSIQKVRFVSSGTEATMSALRLARGFTGRNKILKFEGCYHGHADALLVAAGSGVATLGIPGSPGVPAGTVADTLTAPFNDLGAVEKVVEAHGPDLAAIIVEPVAGNMGCVAPRDGYLQGLRDLATRAGAILVFDEVMTGFRLSSGGAQVLYGIKPDLTCLGKIIGGGLPVGAYGGRADIMDHVAPSGPVYQAGTLSGNPLAMAAGCVTLDLLQRSGTYMRLEMLAARLHAGLLGARDEADVKVTINRVGSMITLFFTPGPVHDYASAKTSDTALFARFFHELLARGIYFPPAQYEAAFVSLAHTESDIDATVRAAGEIFRELRA